MGLWVPTVLPKTCGFTVRVQVKHTVGTGFVGMGVGWTSPTCAVPMCHPIPQGCCPHLHHPCATSHVHGATNILYYVVTKCTVCIII